MQLHRARFFEALESRTLLNAGDLNLAFGGGDGRLLLSPPSGGGVASAVATQPDGKFVLAGSAVKSAKSVLWLERLDAKGILDTTFGSGGVVNQSISHFRSSYDIARQSDGKFVVVGEATAGGFIARFTSSGKLDTSFGGGDGVATASAILYKLTILANGKMAALGSDQRVYEFNTNGSANIGFGSNGTATFVTKIPDGGFGALDIDAQTDNKLVLTGTFSFFNIEGVPGVVRLTNTGKLDKTFGGGDGFTYHSFSGHDRGIAGAIQSTGRIVFAAIDDNSNTFVTSLNSNGSNHFTKMADWSSSFAEGGSGIAVDSSDRIVLIGHTDLDAQLHPSQEFGLMRFSPEGVEQFTKTIDFSMPGHDRDDFPRAVAIAGDGNIIIVGDSSFITTAEDPKIAITSIQGNSGGPSDKLPVTVTADQITVTGTGHADTIRLYRDGFFIEVNGNIGRFLFEGRKITINAGGGNDRIEIIDSEGDDPVLINGGSGNDTMIGGKAGDTFIGGSGIDTVDYSGRTENLNISLDNKANDGAAGEHDNVMADVENILGGSGNDKIVGNPSNNLLKGNGGNDSLYGGSGNDTLDGGSGRDLLFGQDGDDLLLAKDGRTDSLDGGAGFDKAQRDNSATIKDQVLGIEMFV